MQRFISFLLIIALCLGMLPVSAEEIGEKNARPVVTATPEPIMDEAAFSPYAVQDPAAFGGGSVSFYTNEDNTYCKRRVYQVSGMSAQAFAEKYAEACKKLGTMTYLETTASPSGWVYLCFVPAADYTFDDFSTSSGDWTTGSLCLSISYAADSSYITLRFSLDLELADLGYRLADAVPTAAPQPTAAPADVIGNVAGSAISQLSSFLSKAKTATATPVPTATPTVVPTAAPTAASISVAAEPAAVDFMLQDPLAFYEGCVSLLSKTDNQYLQSRTYFIENADFTIDVLAQSYIDLCKRRSDLKYLGFTYSPSGMIYYVFTPAEGYSYTLFSRNSGDWTTGGACLCISYEEKTGTGIHVDFSLDMKLTDSGYRYSAMPTPTPRPAEDDQFKALKETWLSGNQYYYNQLSQEHKQAFADCIANVLNYPSQSAATPRDARRQALGPMIKTDNPRIFWVDWIDSNGWLRYNTGDVAHMRAVQFPEGETLATLQTAFLDAIPAAVAQIKKDLPKNASTRDTVKAIHDWLCKNNSYNEKQTSSHKRESDPVAFAYLAAHAAFSAIIPGDAYEPVCEGYAGAFQILCEEFGIEAICVPGYAKNIGSHTWNYVKLDDGQWYLVDVDADDLAASYIHTYFLLTESQRAQYGYEPAPYLGSGVNPSNGYTEGASFTFPKLAE